jgi:arsenate reductase
MKKVFYLSTCDTCRRILKQLNLKEKGFILQDIKTEKITESQIEELENLAGSYEALFSRTSRKYKENDLDKVSLDEKTYKKLILDEYTFLKRPVIVFQRKIFIGNSKNIIAEAQKSIR